MPKIPSWTGKSVPALTKEAFFDELERLESSVIAVEALATQPPTRPAALTDAVHMTDRTRDLVQSLLTVCRARQSLNAADTLAVTWRADVRRLSDRLEKAASAIYDSVSLLAEDVQSRPPFCDWLSPLTTVNRTKSDVSSAVILPLTAMHSHLVSTMKLRLPLRDGRQLNLSYAQATGVLKTSDDSMLRRAVFSMFNAWFGEHAPAFADLLNAMLGWKLLKADKAAQGDFMTSALTAERMSMPSYIAMTSAVKARVSDIQRTVTYRASLMNERRLHVTQILASAPHPGCTVPASLMSIHAVMTTLSRAMVQADPAFATFMNEAQTSRWIDAKPQSGRAGGTWCENLPAFKAVAIFANFVPSTAGAFQFVHPCGVGFLHRLLHEESALRKRLPFSILEIFGMLAETMLERALLRELRGTSDESAIVWQMLRRASNLLLMVPARHELLASLYRARLNGVLSVSEINEHSYSTWNEFFGNTTDGFDQYAWAWKPHFYHQNIAFYDWQYTFGYLVSLMLAKSFEATGKTPSGYDLKTFAVDAAHMDCEELLRKHLQRDVRSIDFWDEAIAESLKPIP